MHPLSRRISARSRAITRGGVIPLRGTQLPQGRIKEPVVPCCCTPRVYEHNAVRRGARRERKTGDAGVSRLGETLGAFQRSVVEMPRNPSVRSRTVERFACRVASRSSFRHANLEVSLTEDRACAPLDLSKLLGKFSIARLPPPFPSPLSDAERRRKKIR